MARRRQLQQLVTELKAEVGWSTHAASATGVEGMLRQMLRRVQEKLYDDYDWPHLRVMAAQPLWADQRHYDFPEGLSLEGVEEVWAEWNFGFHRLERGIGFEHYEAYDSARDERSDPPCRWDVRRVDDDVEMIEVWPKPASNSAPNFDSGQSNGFQLWVKGKRDLFPFVEDDDLSTLDGTMLVLFAAAEILARENASDASAKLSEAQARLVKLKSRSQGDTAPANLGGRPAEHQRHRGTVVIVGR